MDHSGVILQKLRELKKLRLRDASRLIGRSAGWLSEVENGRGASRLHPNEFERIVRAYDGEEHRNKFGLWVAKSRHLDTPVMDLTFGGSVLKFLRKKAGLSLVIAASRLGVTPSYLSRIECGERLLSADFRNRLMRLYGYSPSSFKNFTTEDKRSKNIPVRFKLAHLLKQFEDEKIEQVFHFALSIAAPSSDVRTQKEGRAS